MKRVICILTLFQVEIILICRLAQNTISLKEEGGSDDSGVVNVLALILSDRMSDILYLMASYYGYIERKGQEMTGRPLKIQHAIRKQSQSINNKVKILTTIITLSTPVACIGGYRIGVDVTYTSNDSIYGLTDTTRTTCVKL